MTDAQAVALYRALFGCEEVGVAGDEPIMRMRSSHFRCAVEALLGDGMISSEHYLATLAQRKADGKKPSGVYAVEASRLRELGLLLTSMGSTIVQITKEEGDDGRDTG